jgi:alcohol dehydrogenase
MAGLAFSNASLGLVHAMAHSLGGAFGLPHGECNALLLEKVVKFNYPSVADKYDQLAIAMGLNIGIHKLSERGDVISDHIASLRKKLNINLTLKELGVKSSDIPQLARFAFNDPCLATNPKEADIKDIESLYMQIYN